MWQLTSLANKGQRCCAACTQPFPIIPQGSAVLRRSGQTGPVGVLSDPGDVPWRPLPGFPVGFLQADPDEGRDAAGRSHPGQGLHVIPSLDGDQVGVVVPAVRLGLGPRHALGYQGVFFPSVRAQSDATCRGDPDLNIRGSVFFSHVMVLNLCRYWPAASSKLTDNIPQTWTIMYSSGGIEAQTDTLQPLTEFWSSAYMSLWFIWASTGWSWSQSSSAEAERDRDQKQTCAKIHEDSYFIIHQSGEKKYFIPNAKRQLMCCYRYFLKSSKCTVPSSQTARLWVVAHIFCCSSALWKCVYICIWHSHVLTCILLRYPHLTRDWGLQQLLPVPKLQSNEPSATTTLFIQVLKPEAINCPF